MEDSVAFVLAPPEGRRAPRRRFILRAAEYESFLFEKRLISTRAEHKGPLTGLPRRRRSSARRLTPGRGFHPAANLKPRSRGFSLPS